MIPVLVFLYEVVPAFGRIHKNSVFFEVVVLLSEDVLGYDVLLHLPCRELEGLISFGAEWDNVLRMDKDTGLPC